MGHAWRMSLPLFLEGEVFAVLDDDLMLQRRWLERALAEASRSGGVVAAWGDRVRLRPTLQCLQRVADPPQTTEVDYGLCGYVAPREVFVKMWTFAPQVLGPNGNGEDMCLSAAARMLGRGTCVVRAGDDARAQVSNYGSDAHASWMQNPRDWKRVRGGVLGKLYELGWRPLCEAT